MKQEHIELLAHCARENPPSFNFNKALEETGEFNEVLLKLQTKHPDGGKRPPKNEAIKEFGDMYYRGLIAIMTIFPELNSEEILEEVGAHVAEKLDKLIHYKEAERYTGGL